MVRRVDDLRARLRRSLNELDSRVETEWDAIPAAVLIPIYQEEGHWKLLFTRRTDSVDVHAGQVSFPGGQIEASDGTAISAALREAEEEIGLNPADVDTLGQLNPLFTVTQFLIHPVVGFFPWPYSLTPNPSEVARTFGVPIDWLSDPKNLEVRERRPMISGPNVRVYYFKEFEGETIWGVTARITLNFLQLVNVENR
ncbi:MAG: CoA pyrophosphatase [Chloroflexi bacterium]|nr:CoA pyrophosphatase [Chloroflexota bacterium]